MADPAGTYEHNYTCQEIVELVTDFVDGALPQHETTLFEVHLAFCTGCRTFVEQIRSTSALAARLTDDELPAHVREELLHAFRDWRRA